MMIISDDYFILFWRERNQFICVDASKIISIFGSDPIKRNSLF
jgi:hypothetical protein